MCVPRRVIPGTTHFVTRRCAQRMFLLTPSVEITTAVRFAYLLAALKYGIQLHAVVVMSNHVHAVLTDPEGTLPQFMEEANRLVARSLNAHYGRKESFWAPGSFTSQECTSPEAALERMVYAVTNPVAAGLVKRASLWPGWVTSPKELDGRAISAQRPGFFYRDNGPVPPEATGSFCPPPGFEHLSTEEFIAEFERRVRARERQLQEEHGGRFLGRREVLRKKPHDAPKTREPLIGSKPALAPRLLSELFEWVRGLRAWRRAYRAARDAYVNGDLGVVFPFGTYWMKRFSPARVAAAPDIGVQT